MLPKDENYIQFLLYIEMTFNPLYVTVYFLKITLAIYIYTYIEYIKVYIYNDLVVQDFLVFL